MVRPITILLLAAVSVAFKARSPSLRPAGHGAHQSLLAVEPTEKSLLGVGRTGVAGKADLAFATPPHIVCISQLSVLYFTAFLAIVVARTGLLCIAKFSGKERDLLVRDVQQWPEGGGLSLDGRLETASDVLLYVPALCILFLAARVWSLHSNGGALAPWMTYSMTAVSYAILVEYLLKVLEPKDPRSWATSVCSGLGALAGLIMHAGAAFIVISILTSPFKPSLAMQCITLLTSVYFSVHALLAVHKGFLWIFGAPDDMYSKQGTKGFAQVQHLKEALALFPMLCIILVCVRMRALELNVEPAPLTNHGMTAVAFAGGFHVLSVVLQIMCTEQNLGERIGTLAGTILWFVETACLIAVACGVTIVFVELLSWDVYGKVSLMTAMNSAAGPIPTSMKCVTTLSVLYFLAYMSVLVARCVQYVSAVFIYRESYSKGRVEEVLDHTCKAVVFAPMLSMLMITLRLRSQTLGMGDPVEYAQLAMIVSVGALLAQVLIAPVSSVLTGTVFGEDSANATDAAKYCAVAFMVGHYVTVAVFYAALSTLLWALCF